MMERLAKFLIFLCVLLTALAPADAYTVKSVFVFGDSLLDAGNNKFIKNCKVQANYTPYGLSYFHFPTGRFTNGRIFPDFISQYLGIEFQKPYEEVHRQLAKNSLKKGLPANGLNFASAGSGFLQDTNKDGKVTTFQGQLQHFESLIAQKLLDKQQIKKSLFFLGTGATDIFTYYMIPGAMKMTPKQYIDTMLKEVIHFTSTIYKYGGRRFLFFDISPAGCIPGRVLVRGASPNECIDQMNNMVKYFNAGLKRIVFSIPRRYPRAIGVYGPMYDHVMKYRKDPKPYGFTNVTNACCGAGALNGVLQCGYLGYHVCLKPNGYLFWDFFHPTEHAYELVAKAFWAGNKKEIWPINLKTLASIPFPPHDINTTIPFP